MKYASVNPNSKNAMRLQDIGWVLGTPASEIKKGDTLMWNFGMLEFVQEILKETEKTVIVSILIKGTLYERRLLKTRLVCILQN